MSSLILGLAEQVQDPRLSLACGTSNLQPGYNNLFSNPVFGPTWARWVREGPPDDTEDFQMTEGMNGIHLAVAHWAYRGQIPAFERAMQQLGRHFQQLQLACQTKQDDQSVILEDFPLGATLLLGTSYDLEYDRRRYVEVLEMWTSHLLRRVADAIYNFFGVRLQDALREHAGAPARLRQPDPEGERVLHRCPVQDWMGELWLGLNIWLDATSQLLSACLWSPQTMIAMAPRAPRPANLFGLRKSSLTVRALRRHAPRFAGWAVGPEKEEQDTLMDAKFLLRRNQMGAKGMSMLFRSTMDYSAGLRPARGAIKFRWDIVGDGHLEFNFEHRRADLGWTASHHWDPCPGDSEHAA